MAQLGMRQPTDTFIDAFADSAPGLETTSSDGLGANAQSTDTALAMLPLLAADVPLPLASTVGGALTQDLAQIDFITIYGTEGDDIIQATKIYTDVFGLGGNDTIYGAAGGLNHLSGDEGNDILYGYGGGNSLF